MHAVEQWVVGLALLVSSQAAQGIAGHHPWQQQQSPVKDRMCCLVYWSMCVVVRLLST
jgi:hypothetical protein